MSAAQRIELLLREVAAVCRRHALSLSHEDGHGAFMVEPFDPELERWLLEARPAGNVSPVGPAATTIGALASEPWSVRVEKVGDPDEPFIQRTIVGKNLGGGVEVAIVTTGSYTEEVEAKHAQLLAAAPRLARVVRDLHDFAAAGWELRTGETMREALPEAFAEVDALAQLLDGPAE